MRTRKPAGSIVSSPLLIGAVTMLIVGVAVFLSYNANQGLPFVPTYDLKAEVPNGAKLVEGNEVRLGGYRVGAVDTIRTIRRDKRTLVILDMKLDKKVEPLAVDSAVQIRPRSALGLKYVEISPGNSPQKLLPGETVGVGNDVIDDDPPEDIEDVLGTFDAATRQAAQDGLEGFGDALAGRGRSINEAIAAFGPLLRALTPVVRNLNDPDTELSGFFRGLGRAAAEAAPVAEEQAELFANMADTFEAFSRDPDALRASIEEGPATQEQAISSFRQQRPFLTDFADLSRRLRPAARELPRSLPALSDAFRVGTPVLRRSVRLSGELTSFLGDLEELGEDPDTLMAINQLDTTVSVSRPLVEFVAPYQTVCNYAVYFLDPLGRHISQPGGGGTVQRILLKQANRNQRNSLTTRQSSRPVDVQANEDSQQPGENPPAALHTQFQAPAIQANGAADCEAGQTGYPRRLARDSRYGPNELGGRAVVLDPDTPGLRGGTFKARELGIDNLKDVP